MMCNKCGAQNADENKICSNCGNVLEAEVIDAAQEQTEAPAEEIANETPAQEPAAKEEDKLACLKKYLGNKKIVAAALAVIIVLGIIICACCSGSDEFVKGDFSVIYDEGAEESHIIYAGEVIVRGVSGKISLKECATGEAALYLDEEKTLYVVTEDGSKKVADEVNSLKGFSADGEKVAYMDADYASVIHNIKNGDKKVFSEDSTSGIVFSPNGDLLGYTVIDTESGAEGEDAKTVYKSYVYEDGESTKVFDGGSIIAISDSGKYIYCSKTEEDTMGESSLYVTNLKGEKKKIASNINNFAVNADGTQVIFESEDKWYASVKGDEKIRIEGVSSSVSSFAPLNGNESFKNNTFIAYADGELAIYTVNGKWSAEKLAGGIDDLRISVDGETIYYLKNDKLYILGEDEAIEDEVKTFVLTTDGAAVYFISEDDTLYYKKGTKDKKRIADDIATIRMTYDDYALFIDEDDVLYASNGGSAAKKLCEDVKRVYTCIDYTYYYGDADSSADTVNVYIASKKTKFEKIFTDIKA
jgi:hypothetical protein